MDKEKKSYYFNVIEAKDGKMNEVMNFNFGVIMTLPQWWKMQRHQASLQKTSTPRNL